ncbi:TD and POZ domain-containing protein 4-like isoform X2 [Leptopilina boulardi]|uniref:TD and POZ domain-containing protein 4-like isoform X2 n=1 Tax=Leptopilina boulardi TaxID=63433 RepID=UPI0021F6681A|nr:TD and POZ domain-containing protein 4-like isoform X2 [Leptopilina boulardi]XP_051161495.1 TD and POZ domain-containing protein 4-like isoform X2 [Leptopilina boulardi]
MDENMKDISELEGITNFQWSIFNFSIYEHHTSDLFSINGIPNAEWFIEFLPQKHNNKRDDEKTYSYFQLCNKKNSNYYCENKPVKIEIFLGTVRRRRIFSIIEDGLICTFKNIIQTCELVQLLDDILRSLYVNLRVTPLNNKKKTIDTVSPTNYNNFEPFLMSDQLSDVIFKIGNKEFPAHKIMLISASPVFEKMFSHQMKENITNTVEVNDTDPDVFKEMLNFIYIGKVNNSKIIAIGLYIVANKYDISTMKIICGQYLEKCLAVVNVISIFELAHLYNSLNLKKKCIDYIDKNFKYVKETQDFKDLSKELLMELFCIIKG